MKFIEYIKDKSLLITTNILIYILIASFIMLYNSSMVLLVAISMLFFFPLVTIILYDYIHKAIYYKTLLSNLESLDKKYLLPAIINKPDFIEGKILHHVLKTTNKSMHENVNKYKYLQSEYREYIETWVHEIKTPISSSKLIIENNPSPVTLSIKEEIEKIESFVEQSLFYSRSNNVEKDYIIKGFPLRESLHKVIKKNSKYFIQNKIKLDIDNVDYTVYSDSKWLEFILNQVINNAIKYRSDNPFIKIYAEENTQNIKLYISDNGIGINSSEINKIFDKGYTGTTGREYEKATGMGLYLSNKLSKKLHLSISASSVEGEGTTICITFPRGKMALLKD